METMWDITGAAFPYMSGGVQLVRLSIISSLHLANGLESEERLSSF